MNGNNNEETMKILLASPRGFCAGVQRAIDTVELALKKYGKPIYVRHEIVHNKSVVNDLKKQGAVFVSEVDEIPEGSIVIFSAHGIEKKVYEDSDKRKLISVDATCPLVSKVHIMSKRHEKNNAEIVLIGHKGHPEVIGTTGQVSRPIHLVEKVEDVDKLTLSLEQKIAYITQTTLSLDETKDIIQALKQKYPHIIGPKDGDLCYATTNRQKAIKLIAKESDLILILGSKNSSNSTRLMELGKQNNIPSYLIDNHKEINLSWFNGVKTIGISSGASAPEYLVFNTVEYIKNLFPNTSVEERIDTEENMNFPIPKMPETV